MSPARAGTAIHKIHNDNHDANFIFIATPVLTN